MGEVVLPFGDELGEVMFVQLSFSLLQCFLDNAKACLNGRHSFAFGGFAPDPHQFGKCNLQSIVPALVRTVSVMVAYMEVGYLTKLNDDGRS